MGTGLFIKKYMHLYEKKEKKSIILQYSIIVRILISRTINKLMQIKCKKQVFGNFVSLKFKALIRTFLDYEIRP